MDQSSPPHLIKKRWGHAATATLAMEYVKIKLSAAQSGVIVEIPRNSTARIAATKELVEEETGEVETLVVLSPFCPDI